MYPRDFYWPFWGIRQVNHNILLEKLKAYGIQSENLKWFRSYLSNRKQFISYDDSKTEMKTVEWGVPQGSILGSLLFLTFVNDLNNSTKVLDPVLFADDANLWYIIQQWYKGCIETANQELGQISDWFLANKLSLNVEKTKYMLFYKFTDQENIHSKLLPLQLNGNIIERENSWCYPWWIFNLEKSVCNLLKLRSQKTSVFFIKQVAMSNWFPA